MNDFALERGSPGGTPPIWGHRMLLRVFLQFARVAMDRSDGIKIAVAKEDDGIFRLAKASCGLDQRVENWLQIKRRVECTPADGQSGGLNRVHSQGCTPL